MWKRRRSLWGSAGRDRGAVQRDRGRVGFRLAYGAARPIRHHAVGTLEFTTRDGETFILHPGDVLLAADTTGSGHRWRLIDDQPWRRVYVGFGGAGLIYIIYWPNCLGKKYGVGTYHPTFFIRGMGRVSWLHLR